MNTTTLKTCSGRLDVALSKGGHARMQDALGWRVTAAKGTLWVTQDGDRRDVVLKAGESFAFDRPAALVSALGAATAQFAQAEAHSQVLRGARADSLANPAKQVKTRHLAFERRRQCQNFDNVSTRLTIAMRK